MKEIIVIKIMNSTITKLPHRKTLAMYRRTLKAMSKVFAGDYRMFHQARIEFRTSVESYQDETDRQKINDLLFQYEETRRILLKNVVQGNLMSDGQYRWKVRPEHAMGASIKN